MYIPDLIGERLDVALDIFKKQCPTLNLEIINPDSSEWSKEPDLSLHRTKRVVRQKLIGNETLELVVYSFKEEPDLI